MKFTRKQKATFKKLHPEAVCPLAIQEAEGMYERGMPFSEVCRRVKQSLTTRQQLPWIKPKYNPAKYPLTPAEEVTVEENTLPTVDEILLDLESYALAAKQAIDAHEANLRSVCKTAQREAVDYFRSSILDFHVQIINVHNWINTGSQRYWVRGQVIRERLSLTQARTKHALDITSEREGYNILRNRIYKRVKEMMKSDSKSALV